MIVLGIDPGYAIVGFGIVEYLSNNFKVIDYGVITTEPEKPFSDRLLTVHKELDFIIKNHEVDCVCVEELFFNKNTKTAINVAQVRGAILLTAKLINLPVYEYTPMQIKQGVVGYGRAEKKQVQEMVRIILNLKSIPRPDDAADALAAAISHCHNINYGKLFKT